MRYLFFSFWLTSLCMTDSRSTHISTNDPVLFLFTANSHFAFLRAVYDSSRCFKSSQNLVWSVFWTVHILISICYFVLLIWISLPSNDVEYLVICLFSSINLLWWSYLFQPFTYILLFLFISCNWVSTIVYIFWIKVPYQLMWFAKISYKSFICLSFS